MNANAKFLMVVAAAIFLAALGAPTVSAAPVQPPLMVEEAANIIGPCQGPYWGGPSVPPGFGWVSLSAATLAQHDRSPFGWKLTVSAYEYANGLPDWVWRYRSMNSGVSAAFVPYGRWLKVGDQLGGGGHCLLLYGGWHNLQRISRQPLPGEQPSSPCENGLTYCWSDHVVWAIDPPLTSSSPTPAPPPPPRQLQPPPRQPQCTQYYYYRYGRRYSGQICR